MLSEQRLLGTYIVVMAKEDICPMIGQVQSAAVPTGLGVSTGHEARGRLRTGLLRTIMRLICVGGTHFGCDWHKPSKSD